MKKILYMILALAGGSLMLTSCMDTDAQYDLVDAPAPKLDSVNVNNGYQFNHTNDCAGLSTVATGVELYPGKYTFTVYFDENVGFATANTDQITLNGTPVLSAVVYGASKALTITAYVYPSETVTLNIPSGLILGPSKKANEEINISWSSINVAPATSLCNANATAEAKALYQSLYNQYGQKTLSGAMANVNWNNDIAEHVASVTGKYPAINCYDFIHLPYDGSWIKYSDMTPVTNWHNNGGIVAAMWHWMVPTEEPGTDPVPQPSSDATIWEGSVNVGNSWGVSETVAASAFASAVEGAVLTVYFSENSDAEYWQAKIMDSSWTALTSYKDVDNGWGCIPFEAGQTSYAITLNAADADLLKAGGAILSGYGITYCKLTLSSASGSGSGSTGGSTVLASDEKVMPADWSGWYKIEASAFANAKAGDVVTAQTKDVAAGAQGSFKDGASWSGLVDDNGTSYEYFEISGDFSLTLDSKTLAAVQANGLIISGHDYTLTGVTMSSASAAPRRTILKAKSASKVTYTVKPDETTFMPSNCLIDGTWENKVWNEDLAKVAGYLKQMQDLGIAVIWRPFHEAKGNYGVYQAGTGAWFWWGREGAEVFKKLWIAMFDYMQAQGINNLVWVWTDIPTAIDSSWYPGNNYVDVVGVDIYNNTDATSITSIKNTLQYTYPNKMVTLSECGSVADVNAQFAAGATWSWFMPWYNDEEGGTYHATDEWWQSAMASPYVITR